MLRHRKKIILLRDGKHIVKMHIIKKGKQVIKSHIIKKGKKIKKNIARKKNIAVRETIGSGEGFGDSLENHSREHHEKIKAGAARFKKEFQKNVTTAIIAAFGLIIALVWRDAIQEIIDTIVTTFNLTGTGYIYKLMAAVIITVVCVIGIMQVSRFAIKEGEDKTKNK